MPTLIELGSHARGMRTNPRDHGASTAVCEGPLDKEQRRRPPELEELECSSRGTWRTSQAGSAARQQQEAWTMTRAPLAATDTLLTRINGRRGQGTVESGKDAVSAYQMPLEMQTLIELRGQPGECARSLRARYASTAVCEGASRQRAATKATGTRSARMRASRQPETYAGRQSSPPAEEHGR